jgi:MFS family permease
MRYLQPDRFSGSGPARLATGRRLRLCFLICMATIVMAVLDSNIVSAAAVPIARDLDPAHGVGPLPWLVTAFSLAATVLLPLYGKLCDMFGAKRIFLGTVATFLIGSALCGAARTMGQLIALRALQGAGAGGLMSVTMVVMTQLAGPERRRRGGAAGGIVAGVGLAVGPAIGAFVTDDLGWRWIFYLNLPLGLLVLIGGTALLRLPEGTGRRSLDVLGAGLAGTFAALLVLVTTWGGAQYSWSSPPVAARYRVRSAGRAIRPGGPARGTQAADGRGHRVAAVLPDPRHGPRRDLVRHHPEPGG